ncbi:MAG: GH25 family lysozyme, partial [Bacteroidaceae bacterium]|nr:GH25 family lysozyme [Bacteroidaceae bacterium]
MKWFFGIPAWAYWVGGLSIGFAYIFFVYYFFVSPYSFRWKAMHSDPVYPEGYNIRGLDISHYQGQIDWETLRNSSMNNDPIRFVFIKATEGMSLMDDNFNLNFYQAKKNDFIRGTYHFFVPDIDPVKQAQFYLHQVHLEPGDLPPVLDVEHTGKCSAKELQRNVKKWLDIVEQRYGVKPILYTGYK